jgi:UDP-N-acetylmuramate dehydrogenase
MELPFAHQREIRLSDFSTFGIGGPARYFAQALSCEEMQEMLEFAKQAQIRVLIIGKGSNSLFDDRGFNGLVILNRIDFLDHDEKGLFRVGSGYSFARLGGLTARLGWSGLEFASGIPASVGGAIYMNAGANGKETADALFEVGFVTEEGEVRRFKKSELQFSYRTSPFQNWKGAIVEATFKLISASSAKKEQRELLAYRLKTQPYGKKSAGCAFRNPKGQAAGKLIEICGLKGESIGDAKVSNLHANFIVNEGKATAQEVLALMNKIKEQIFQKSGILLEEEIRYIPYE